MGVISAIFWGVTSLSFLVFIHEGGHYLSARLTGMRVTEFYLGLPCSIKWFHKSKRYGTEIGVTPILLGGYTRICGMEGTDDPRLAPVLAYIQQQGRVSIEEVEKQFNCSEDDACTMLATLADWAAIEEYWKPERSNRYRRKYMPDGYQTVKRDAHLLTEFDRESDFTSSEGVTVAGEPRDLGMSPEEFLQHEKKHTYGGHGFWSRIITLFMGPLINLLFAFLIVVLALTLAGVDVTANKNVIGAVSEDSLAQASGLEAGDTVESINGETVTDWQSLTQALQPALQAHQDFEMVIERGGQEQTIEVQPDPNGSQTLLGISAPTEHLNIDIGHACLVSLSYAQQVAQAAVSLIIPTHTTEVLNQSTSIMGISVMASEAASGGVWEFSLFVAAISMSLGFMNLLPIPPLDGGKILIEIIQAIIRRPLSQKVQVGISYIGLAFFIFIFIFVTRNDIARFVVGQ